jgi:transcriptional regulator with XRE-family HTH domain
MNEVTARLLGDRIAQIRQTKGFSLGDLAERAGIAKSYISRLEKGESLNLGLSTLAMVATALGTTVHDLLPRQGATDDVTVDPALSGESSVTFETIAGSLPAPLQRFIDDQAAGGKPVPIEAIRALSVLKLRGKHPSNAEDYQFFYDLMKRLIP